MKKLILSLALVCALVPAISLAAFWQASESVSITPSQPAEGNAYVAGQSVNVSGVVRGDLFAAGSLVSVSGDVSQDIAAAGNTVNIAGATGQDLRLAGSNVSVSGKFTGELLAAGANINIAAGTEIAKDAQLAGSIINFAGTSAGMVSLSGERVEFNGSAKSLTVESSELLIVGPNAVIAGDLNYSSPSEAQIDPAAKISGKVNFTEAIAEERAGRAALRGFLTVGFLLKLLSTLLVAYLIWYLRRKDAVEVTQLALSKFGASLLRGFIFLVVVPAGIIVLMLTLIGIPIAIFAALVYVAFLMLASPFTVFMAASLLIKRKMDLGWYHILAGALILAILKFIPILGWLAIFLLYLAALGSLIAFLRAKFKR